jgi:hypothetical protein
MASLPPPQVSWWSIIANKVTSLFKGIFSGDIPGTGGLIGEAIENIPGALIDKVIAKLQEKLSSMMTFAGSVINEGATAFSSSGGMNTMGVLDRGGILPTGPSMVYNNTGKPEPLTNLDLYNKRSSNGLTAEDISSMVSALVGELRSGGDTYNVMLPERASVRELADQLDFKRRVVSKGRYLR